MNHWYQAHFGRRAHLIYGNDGSRRSRLILSRWYVEITLFGRYVNVGVA